MSRTLTAATAAQAASTAAAPINILKVDFGGSIGAKYYSDRTLGSGDGSSALNAAGRVVAWGNIDQRYREGVYSPVGDCRLVLHDADKTLKGYHDSVEFQRRKVTLYQYFAGLAENDLQPVLVGIIAAPVRWNEADATLSFDVTDISTLYIRDLGTIVKREDLPYLARGHEGRTAPLAFGKVRRSPAVPLCDGAITELAKPCFDDSAKLYVMDAERFPQDEAITIRIDGEVIEGSFSGNTFTATRRGADVVANGLTTAARDTFSFYDRALSEIDGTYQGYILEVTDPVGYVHQREICAYSGADKCVTYWPDITYPGPGGAQVSWTIPAGTTYKITSWKNSHETGERVYLGGINYVYLVNDAPSKKERYIEGLGEWTHQVRIAGGDGQPTTQVEYGPPTRGYMRLTNALYTANCNDTSVFGAEHPVTTITFGRHPTEFLKLLEEIRVTFDGVESAGDGSGTLYEEPSDIIQCILTRFAGVALSDIDEASFATAKADGASSLKFAFTLTEVKEALRLVADLAFQARCALLWDDGRVRVQFIRNRVGSSQLTLDGDTIVEDTLEISRTALDDIYSEVVGRYRDQDGAETVVARDAEVEAAFGRRVKEIDLWAYNRKKYANAIVSFWLSRFKRLWTRVRVKTYLPALKLQRRDAVTLDWTDFFSSGQKGRVVEIDHQPGSAEPKAMDTIGLEIELPVHAGCAALCETECETSPETGCFTQCEISAESCWQCETSCEEVCELVCVTISELECVSFDTGCGSSCQTSCQAHCQTACETGCEVVCESACQTSCQTTCETGGCETSCQTACQTSCELGVECINSYADAFTYADNDNLDIANVDWAHSHQHDGLHIQVKSNQASLPRRATGGSGTEYATTSVMLEKKLCSANHKATLNIGIYGMYVVFDRYLCVARVTSPYTRSGYLGGTLRGTYGYYGMLYKWDGEGAFITLWGDGDARPVPSSSGVQARGNEIAVLMNGGAVARVIDNSYLTGCFVGFCLTTYPGDTSKPLRVDNFAASISGLV